MRYIIGIDEAGRGPLAGPVAVGAVKIAFDFDPLRVAGAKDSKKMTPLARERLYATMCALREDGAIDFAVAFSDVQMIDQDGIVPAIQSALESAMGTIASNAKVPIAPDAYEVLLDGGLKAPLQYTNQRTIIGGDGTELAISLASIAAKVERDALMREIAKQFPAYGLEVHKGYGTAAHLKAIREMGVSPIHRASFCSNV